MPLLHTRGRRTRLAAVLAVGALFAAFVPVAVTQSASATPINSPGSASGLSVPTGVTAARVPSSVGDIAVAWNPVAKVDHYNVSVFDGVTDNVTVVPAGTTQFVFHGSTAPCTWYRVTVSAKNAKGIGPSAAPIQIDSLAPGTIPGIKGVQSVDRSTADVTWKAPVSNGYAPLDGYTVQLVRLVDNAVLVSDKTTNLTYSFSGLSASLQYGVRVTPYNSYGACHTARVLLSNGVSSQPTGLGAVRDAGQSDSVTLTWLAPSWPGDTAIQYYLVGYGIGRVTSWVQVSGLTTTLKLEPKYRYAFQVKAVNGQGASLPSAAFTLRPFGAPGTHAVPPNVKITNSAGLITVTTTSALGSTVEFPKLVLRVRPSLKTGTTFADTQYSQNGAQSITFGTVPCGVYTVTVSGQGGKGESELARQYINECNSGSLGKVEWKVIRGFATLGNTGNISMTAPGENRVISTRVRSSADMILTSDVTLSSGWGYGVWSRASFDSAGNATGYSFQYDPGYANVSSFGQALLLRQWNAGTECSTPLQVVHWPAGMTVYAKHHLVVVVQGDQLYATLDNVVVFNVPSLTKAVAASPCHWKAPTGKTIGFRTWNTSPVSIDNTSLN